MTRQELTAENALLRELVITQQAVRWLRENSGGQPLRDAYQRLTELERWAAVRGITYSARGSA